MTPSTSRSAQLILVLCSVLAAAVVGCFCQVSNQEAKVRQEITHTGWSDVIIVMDKSGSMAGLEADTIGGFNSMIERQKKVDGKCYVTTVLFDTRIDRIHDRVDLKDIQPMTERDYMPGGCTALLDAMGNTIDHIVHIHKYARPEDVPEYTTFVIMTDGLENASHCYSSDEVKRKVEHGATV